MRNEKTQFLKFFWKKNTKLISVVISVLCWNATANTSSVDNLSAVLDVYENLPVIPKYLVIVPKSKMTHTPSSLYKICLKISIENSVKRYRLCKKELRSLPNSILFDCYYEVRITFSFTFITCDFNILLIFGITNGLDAKFTISVEIHELIKRILSLDNHCIVPWYFCFNGLFVISIPKLSEHIFALIFITQSILSG